ncbi:MFS transporter [Rhodoplanes elegans]|uniref:MFS transporter n=1 Tax=Rhodoplanes elegans TaxID=29408 RepID=A0A327KTJ8_9BRAD|nr:tripartite tricarboxylate transporter substrate binding protein [Rhodoplanes elegans]MBK5959837.1 MFS transporter [Rhodoplanes elegans]RAI41671.1 MFS transporter [Rhodoplanes elegans]
MTNLFTRPNSVPSRAAPSRGLSRRACVVLAAVAATTLGLAATAVAALDYPTRPVRWIVSYPPGGATDITARLVGQAVSERLGQQVVIENRAGAGNNIGTEIAINAAPDGYTLFFVNPANTINATLYKKLSFDFVRDIQGVAGIIRVPNVMVVTPSVPAKTVQEFIDWVKANPGKVNLASSGNGTSIHLSGELFMAMTGAKMTHVPYRGSAPAVTDLLAGQVHVMFDNLPSAIEHIRAGRLRALAVTTAERSAMLPDVPTVAETVKGYEASGIFGMGIQKAAPKEIVDRLNAAVNESLDDPKLKTRLVELGGIVMKTTPAEFQKTIEDETAKWGKAVQFSGASVD